MINLTGEQQVLKPEDLVEDLQKEYRKGEQPPNYCLQSQKLLNTLEQKRDTINEVLTEKQSDTFWELFDLLKTQPLKMANGNILIQIMAFALSRDIDLNSHKVIDVLDVYSVGLNSQILQQLVNSKNIYEASKHFDDYRMKTRCYSFSLNSSIDLEWPQKYRILEEIEKHLEHLLMLGTTTEKFSSPEIILDRLFKGITTVSLRPVSAHGAQKAFPLAAYMHDIFHHDVCHEAMIDSLIQFTAKKVFDELDSGMDIRELVTKWGAEATKRFDALGEALSAFHRRAINAGDFQTQAGLFHIFHEGGNALMRAEDWDDYQNLPKLLENLISRMKSKSDKRFVREGVEETKEWKDNGTDWNSPLDPFVTDPQTGKIEASDEHLLSAAKKEIKEFVTERKAEFTFNKVSTENDECNVRNNIIKSEHKAREKLLTDFATITGQQRCKYDFDLLRKQEKEEDLLREKLKTADIDLTKAKQQASLVQVELKKTKRFVQAAVNRTYTFEPEYVSFCTTLYHKRRNAWDTYSLLGGAEGTGLPKPSDLKDRDETMEYLKVLYQDKLPRALEQTVSACKRGYQVIPYKKL